MVQRICLARRNTESKTDAEEALLQKHEVKYTRNTKAGI
jgi:hypothetical protein